LEGSREERQEKGRKGEGRIGFLTTFTEAVVVKEMIPDPVPPQPLGILIMFPATEEVPSVGNHNRI
jgi:hypothetical protein